LGRGNGLPHHPSSVVRDFEKSNFGGKETLLEMHGHQNCGSPAAGARSDPATGRNHLSARPPAHPPRRRVWGRELR
jgi:hypothetical protein